MNAKNVFKGGIENAVYGLLILSLILVPCNVYAYANPGDGNCTCSSCADCTAALNDNSCSVVKLNESIINYTGTCINNPVNFNNKIFDCQNHGICGKDLGYGNNGIYLDGKSGNDIMNCEITDFYFGIDIRNSNNNKINNNTVNSNMYYGIRLYASNRNNITNNSVNFNTEDGITLWDNSQNNRIIKNIANSNNNGIYVSGTNTFNNHLTNNTANSNNNGIQIYQSNNNNIVNNTANSNNNEGIYLWNSDGNNLTQNTAISNNNRGIYLYSSDENIILNNVANFNDYGIYLYSSLNNNVSSNVVCSNNNTDVYDTGTSNPWDENYCDTTVNWNDAETTGCSYACPVPPVFNSPGKEKGENFAIAYGIIDINITAKDPSNDLLSLNLTIYNETFTHDVSRSHETGTWYWHAAWNSSEIADGEYTMKAVSTYNNSNLGIVEYSTKLPVRVANFDNTPPDMTITHPADSSTVSGIVNVSVNASDSGAGMWWIFFYVDGDLRNIDFDPPYVYEWDTAQESCLTEHNITAVAYDDFGNKVNDSISVFVDDETPPTINILFPSENTIISPNDFLVGNKTRVLIKADDAGNISSVRAKIDDGGWVEGSFYESYTYRVKVNGTCFTGDRYAGEVYVVEFNSDFVEGSHNLFVEAYDGAAIQNKGNLSGSFIFDETSPVIHNVDPQSLPGYVVSGTIPITVNATDENGICRVDFYVTCYTFPESVYAGSKSYSDIEYPYTYFLDTNDFSDGLACNVYVQAADNSGMVKNDKWGPPHYILIDNENSPLLEIISPGGRYIERGFTFASDSIYLVVNATDINGIKNVSYRIDNKNWNNLTLNAGNLYEADIDLTSYPEGYEHILNVKAVDNIDYESNENFYFMVDRTPPSVYEVLPANNSIEYGISIVFASVYDANPYTVTVLVNDTPVCSEYFDKKNCAGSLNCFYDTWNFSNGLHQVGIRVEDAAGNSISENRTVNIKNAIINVDLVEGSGGSYKIYTTGENSFNLTINVSNEGVADDYVFVKVFGLPERYWTYSGVPSNGSVLIKFNIELTEFEDGMFSNNGYSPGTYEYNITVTSILGHYHDAVNGSFSVFEGPVFNVTGYTITATGDGDLDVESGEGFNFTFTLKNSGDETINVIDFYPGYRDNVEYFRYGYPTKNNFAPGDTWTINSAELFNDVFDGFNSGVTGYNFAGDAKINLRLKYESAGKNHTTYFYEPITIPVSLFNKQFYEESNKSRDMEVNAKGVTGDNVLADLKNIGKVYYTYQYTGYYGDWTPSYDRTKLVDWEKLRAFIPPGGKKKLNISNAKVGNDYEFQTYFQYSIVHNELNGLLIAASGYPGFPPVDIFLGLILDAAYESGIPADSITDATILDVVLEDEKVRTKLFELGGKLGYEMGEEAFEKWLDDFTTGVSFVKTVLGFANWVADNLDPDTVKPITMNITVKDPPDSYTVEFENPARDLYFGSFSNVSTFGNANIRLTLYNNGSGSCNASYSATTEDMDFDKGIFDHISGYEITKEGRLINSSLYGNVTIRVYPVRETTVNLSSYLLRDDFVMFLVQPHLNRIDKVEKRLGAFIEISGTGVLSSSAYDESVYSFTAITGEKISSEIYSYGKYAAAENDSIVFNASFGSRFNVPLSRTNLTILLPYKNNTFAQSPDNITGNNAFWNQTPSRVIIYSAPTTYTVCPNGCGYAGIQTAVNASCSGDTILVYGGTYHENVNVTRQINLVGVDTGSGKPVVSAVDNGSAITLSANGILLDGFIVVNAGNHPFAGIKVTSNNNTLTNNTVIYNQFGLYLTNNTQDNKVVNNLFCSNINYDIYNGDTNSGENNTCDTAHNRNDVNATGCTSKCSGQGVVSITISKYALQTSFNPGHIIDYVNYVNNTGNKNATNITIHEKMDNSTELITYSSYCSDGINLTCDYNTSTHEINCIRDILEANAYCGLNVTVNTSDMCSDIQNALSVSQAMVNDSYLYCWGWDPFTCVVGYDGEIGTRSIKNWVNVTGCLKSCDLNGDGIIINGWNDLMPAYKCFLGIQTNCDLNHQNWGLMKQEYQCFSAS